MFLCYNDATLPIPLQFFIYIWPCKKYLRFYKVIAMIWTSLAVTYISISYVFSFSLFKSECHKAAASQPWARFTGSGGGKETKWWFQCVWRHSEYVRELFLIKGEMRDRKSFITMRNEWAKEIPMNGSLNSCPYQRPALGIESGE